MAVHIGTSGWHYKHWKGPFYPEKLPASKMLEWYARHFDTVELNNTFYRLPPETGVQGWRDGSPPRFCFAAKGSRFLTHMKKLKDPEEPLDRFFSRARQLGPTFGPVLYQLPPRWSVNVDRLATFLDQLPARRRHAIEEPENFEL